MFCVVFSSDVARGDRGLDSRFAVMTHDKGRRSSRETVLSRPRYNSHLSRVNTSPIERLSLRLRLSCSVRVGVRVGETRVVHVSELTRTEERRKRHRSFHGMNMKKCPFGIRWSNTATTQTRGVGVGFSKRTTPRSRGPSEDVLQDRGRIVMDVFWNGKEAPPEPEFHFVQRCGYQARGAMIGVTQFPFRVVLSVRRRVGFTYLWAHLCGVMDAKSKERRPIYCGMALVLLRGEWGTRNGVGVWREMKSRMVAGPGRCANPSLIREVGVTIRLSVYANVPQC
jgi:hypothetical protein